MEIWRERNQATTIYFPLVDRGTLDFEATPVTFAAGDVQFSVDKGAFTNTTNLPAHEGNGFYSLDLVAAEVNGQNTSITIIDSATKLWEDQGIVISTYGDASAEHAVNLNDTVRAGLTALPNAAAEAAGGLYTRGTGAGQINQPSNGQVDVNIVAMAANVLTAAAINADAITAAKIADGAIDAATFAAGAIDNAAFNVTETLTANPAAGGIVAGSFGAGAIDAAAIGTGAVDADALASDAVTKLRSLLSGTSDAGGSTTTMVDAALTELDDVHDGLWIMFTSGALVNQTRLITNFDAASDTITFAPAVTATVGAGFAYEILPNAAVDVQSWLGTVSGLSAVNALVAGRVDVSVGAMVADIITAAVIANGAIDAATFAAGAINAAAIATDAIDNTKIAAGAITSSEAPNLDQAVSGNATPAEVLTQINAALDTAISELGVAAPTATPTVRTALMLLYMAFRNETLTTATLKSIKNDAGTVIAQATLSDDSTTFTKQELVSG